MGSNFNILTGGTICINLVNVIKNYLISWESHEQTCVAFTLQSAGFSAMRYIYFKHFSALRSKQLCGYL